MSIPKTYKDYVAQIKLNRENQKKEALCNYGELIDSYTDCVIEDLKAKIFGYRNELSGYPYRESRRCREIVENSYLKTKYYNNPMTSDLVCDSLREKLPAYACVRDVYTETEKPAYWFMQPHVKMSFDVKILKDTDGLSCKKAFEE